MGLHDLRPYPGSRKKPRRVGRGSASGVGKTSGRGHKGQKARAGTGKTHRAFEGGQMPLARRVPKRGFTNVFRKEYTVINVRDLNRFKAGATVGEDELRGMGMVKGRRRLIKILGQGDLDRKLVVRAHSFSASAKKKIEEAGGRAEVI